MTTINWVNILTGITSIVLAVVAIVLTLFFAAWSNRAQHAATTALAGIKAQGEALTKLSGKWMDRLTKFATREPTADPNLQQVLAAIGQAPAVPPRPSDGEVESSQGIQVNLETLDGARQAAIDAAIGCLTYTALTNFHAAGYVPGGERYDESNDFHKLVIQHTDLSLRDYTVIKEALQRHGDGRIQKSRYHGIYEEVLRIWEPRLRSSIDAMAEHSKSQADNDEAPPF